MIFGISEISVIPVRRDSFDQSEQVTQLLFGDSFQIIEEKKNWSLIKIFDDNYEGWINSTSITKLSEIEFNEIRKNDSYLVKKLFERILIETSQEIILLPFGSILPNFDKNNKTFLIKNKKYILEESHQKDLNESISDLCTPFLNSPYLWGGKNPFGIDCSGFTQVIYKARGINIPRDANEQVKLGNIINFIGDIQEGDLAFFDNEEGRITHVGIILNQKEIIHSSVKVRIDKIDQQGIYNKEFKKYTHKLRVIKRIIN